MPLSWHGYCRPPVILRQLLVEPHPQSQTRCNANFRNYQESLGTRTFFDDRIGIRSSHLVAAKNHNGWARTFAFAAAQSSLEPPAESSTIDRAQDDTRSDSSSKLKVDETISEETGSSREDFVSLSKKRRSKFAIQEKGKENRLLVNQLLRDKGHLSYDWRVPVELLERNYEFPKSQPPNADISLFRKVASSNDTGSEHQGPRRIQRIKCRGLKETRLARGITRPFVWSKQILADYLEDLVEYEYRKDVIPWAPLIQDKEPSNVADTITALNDIFHAPTMTRYLSVEAYKIALRFYYDHGLFSNARALFIQMEDSRIDIPTEIFNIVLRGSASSRDLHNFTFILQKFIQRGFKPDIETWNALLTTISSGEVRAVIIQRMWERGVLDSLPGEGNALRLIVQQEVGSHIDKRGDRGAFLDHMDDRYGKTWLTTSTGNKLIYEFGKRRSMPETLNLLAGMKLRGWKPDEISLDTLLRQSLLLRQHRYAIEILESFRCHFGLKPGKQAHETLFLLARRSRLLNFARAVWTSACISGHVTWKMRDFLSQSLLSNAAVQPSDGRSKRFKKLVGNFVVGVNRPKEVVSPGTGGTFEAQGPVAPRPIVKSAQMLVQADILAAGSPHISEDFGELLSRALKLDEEWAATKFLSAADLQQVLQSAIQIRRAVPHSQRPRLLIRQFCAHEPHKARVTCKVSNSVKSQEPARSSARSDYAQSLRGLTIVRQRGVRAVPIHKHVVSSKAEAGSQRRLPVGKHIARNTHIARVTCKVSNSVKSREPARSSARSDYAQSLRGLRIVPQRRVRVLRIHKHEVSSKAGAGSQRHLPMGKYIARRNTQIARTIRGSGSSVKIRESSALLTSRRRCRPHSRLPIQKYLAVREEPKSRPPLLKPLVRKEQIFGIPIREHETLPYAKHPVVLAVREPRVTPDFDGKMLPAPLETAHLHSSLDKVLELGEALDKGAKSIDLKDNPTRPRSHLANKQASSTQEAPAPMLARRVPPRERP